MKNKHGPMFSEKGLTYIPGPWFRYRTKDKPHDQYCQPDALVLKDKTSLILLEYKLRHTNDAFLQMEYLYKPVLRKTYPDLKDIVSVEICQFYDPDIQIDLPFELIFDIGEITSNGRFALIDRP